MKPAICCICGNFPAANNEGDWVAFADHDVEAEPSLSHPDGLEYFCEEHINAARCFTSFTAAEALKKIKEGPR